MATIIVNGKSYIGDSVKVIVNGTVIIPDGKEINIEVNGDIKELIVDVCDKCTINGNVVNATTSTGELNINGDVTGDVKTDVGGVKCGNVGGNIKTDIGNVKCGNVGGKVKTEMGNIKKQD